MTVLPQLCAFPMGLRGGFLLTKVLWKWSSASGVLPDSLVLAPPASASCSSCMLPSYRPDLPPSEKDVCPWALGQLCSEALRAQESGHRHIPGQPQRGMRAGKESPAPCPASRRDSPRSPLKMRLRLGLCRIPPHLPSSLYDDSFLKTLSKCYLHRSPHPGSVSGNQP